MKELHLASGDMILDDKGLWAAPHHGKLSELRHKLKPALHPSINPQSPPFEWPLRAATGKV